MTRKPCSHYTFPKNLKILKLIFSVCSDFRVWPVLGAPRNALLFLLITMDLYLVFLLEQPGNSEFRYVLELKQVKSKKTKIMGCFGCKNDFSF